MDPVFDTRATSDVLIAVAKKDPGSAARYTMPDYRTWLIGRFPGGAAARQGMIGELGRYLGREGLADRFGIRRIVLSTSGRRSGSTLLAGSRRIAARLGGGLVRHRMLGADASLDARMDTLTSQADAGNCDVIAKGHIKFE